MEHRLVGENTDIKEEESFRFFTANIAEVVNSLAMRLGNPSTRIELKKVEASQSVSQSDKQPVVNGGSW